MSLANLCDPKVTNNNRPKRFNNPNGDGGGSGSTVNTYNWTKPYPKTTYTYPKTTYTYPKTTYTYPKTTYTYPKTTYTYPKTTRNYSQRNGNGYYSYNYSDNPFNDDFYKGFKDFQDFSDKWFKDSQNSFRFDRDDNFGNPFGNQNYSGKGNPTKGQNKPKQGNRSNPRSEPSTAGSGYATGGQQQHKQNSSSYQQGRRRTAGSGYAGSQGTNHQEKHKANNDNNNNRQDECQYDGKQPSLEESYTRLGLPVGASTDEIKKAYKKLVLKYHPDKTKGDEAKEERFKKISTAYAVLYDQKISKEKSFEKK